MSYLFIFIIINVPYNGAEITVSVNMSLLRNSLFEKDLFLSDMGGLS